MIEDVADGDDRFLGVLRLAGAVLDQRRQGVGTALQQRAIEHCRATGCYQMRSRSPVASTENYALKLDAGYLVQPSEQNDSYYFLLRL